MAISVNPSKEKPFRNQTPKETCGDCGVEEGNYHNPGCDMERCPFCLGQLISCDCCYEMLGLFDHKKYDVSTGYLPTHIYQNGLTKKQTLQWNKILRGKGLIPFIRYPIFCIKCGAPWPEFFLVPNEEWRRYVQPDKQSGVICRECYDYIKDVINNACRSDHASVKP